MRCVAATPFRADFGGFESPVVAGLVRAQGKNNRGGRDKSGDDPRERTGVLKPDWNQVWR